MNQHEQVEGMYVGIDIAKETLYVALGARGKSFEIANTPAAIATLIG